MKLTLLGDLHIRSQPPKHRIDDYYQTQFQKLDHVLQTSHEKNVSAVVFTGDIFNNYGRDSYGLVFSFIEHIMKYNQDIYAVMGQHDIKYHKLDLRETPFHILTEVGVIKQLGSVPVKVDKNTYLYGSSWNEKIPKPKNKKALNILAVHKMVVTKKLWEGQSDFVYAKRMLKKHPYYDLIASGDNHSSFDDEYMDRFICNSGSMCRMRSDQMDHRPRFYIYDTETKKLKKYYIPIEPSENVFSVDKINEEKTKRKKAKEMFHEGKFTNSLRKDLSNKYSFKNLIEKKMSSNKLRDGVKAFIEQSYFETKG